MNYGNFLEVVNTVIAVNSYFLEQMATQSPFNSEVGQE